MKDKIEGLDEALLYCGSGSGGKHWDVVIEAARFTPTLLDRIDELERVMGVMASAVVALDKSTRGKMAYGTAKLRDEALSEHAKLMEGDDATI